MDVIAALFWHEIQPDGLLPDTDELLEGSS